MIELKYESKIINTLIFGIITEVMFSPKIACIANIGSILQQIIVKIISWLSGTRIQSHNLSTVSLPHNHSTKDVSNRRPQQMLNVS